MNRTDKVITSSFRDPSGSVFYRDGIVYRQVNASYEKNYNCLMNSGLYRNLTNAKLLIPHNEIDSYKLIKPEQIPFISYPYEWSFSQLKDAALTTLEIQRRAMNFSMTLKDCSAYNIQFRDGKPILIDTLSFEKYYEGQPWKAYRQFCQHFLAPLALMSHRDIRLSQLLQIHINGIPLDLASLLLPTHTYLIPSLLLHIHMHTRSQRHFANKSIGTAKHRITHLGFLGIVNSLQSAVTKLKWQPQDTEWAEYHEEGSYTPRALEHKKHLVSQFLDEIAPETVWDLGANTGVFSRIASNKGTKVISFDIDPAAVEKNYLECVKHEEVNILPLLLDLANPSPSIGWQNQERMSLLQRSSTDTVLALALVHHLAISNNVPLASIADLMSSICNSLIIEFIPKGDSRVQQLLVSREDIFPNYTQEAFESAFNRLFAISTTVKIRESERVMYLMRRNQ